MYDFSWLPPLVTMEDCGRDWHRYLAAVYQYFQQDFADTLPHLAAKPVKINRTPIHDGKETSFWHIISDGRSEIDRLPNLRRCERIRWPKPIIEAYAAAPGVLSWETYQHGDPRIKLSLADFSYLVVLSNRPKYAFLITAYCVDRERTKRQLQAEYKECTSRDKNGRRP